MDHDWIALLLLALLIVGLWMELQEQQWRKHQLWMNYRAGLACTERKI
jgi:hypothetical protein